MSLTDWLQKKNRYRMTLLLGALVFFFCFMIGDGPKMEVDSESYLNYSPFIMSIPIYPLFIALARLIPFPGGGTFDGYTGVWQAVILQNLLWAYATYRIGMFAAELCVSGKKSDATQGMAGDTTKTLTLRAMIAGVMAMVFQFGVALLNRFAAPRKAMYSNHVVTEAIAMPLFLLFIISLYRLCRERNRKEYAACTVLAFLLLGSRLQMKVVLLIWGGVSFLYDFLLKRTRRLKGFLLTVFLIVITFVSNTLFVNTVNYFKFGKWSDLSNPGTLFCNLLYTAGDDDAELFEKEAPELRECFIRIHEKQKESNALLSMVPEGADIFERRDHYANAYDEIGFTIAISAIRELADEKGLESGEDWPRYFRETEEQLVSVLMKQDLTKYASVALMNILVAFVYSNARFSPSFLLISVALYALYLVLFFLLRHKSRKEEKAEHIETSLAAGRVLQFSAIVFIALAFNAIVVGMMIFPQGRYMIYCMGLFYTAILLMVISLMNDY